MLSAQAEGRQRQKAQQEAEESEVGKELQRKEKEAGYAEGRHQSTKATGEQRHTRPEEARNEGPLVHQGQYGYVISRDRATRVHTCARFACDPAGGDVDLARPLARVVRVRVCACVRLWGILVGLV